MKNLRGNILDVAQSSAMQSGAIDGVLPEYKELRLCIENNPWHDHQSVFDHTILSVASFERLFVEVSNSKKASQKKLTQYLQDHVYGLSRIDLIRLSLLFHDIGKPMTWKKDVVTGMTSCPRHELISSTIVIEKAGVFGTSHGAVRTVAQLVLHHGTVHEVVNMALSSEIEAPFESFHAVVGDLYVPLLLISRSDAQGSDLSKIDSSHLKKHIDSIDAAISRFIASL